VARRALKFGAGRRITGVALGLLLASCRAFAACALRPFNPAFAIGPFSAAAFPVKAIRTRLPLGDVLDLWSFGAIHRQDPAALQRARLGFRAAGPLLWGGLAAQIGRLRAPR